MFNSLLSSARLELKTSTCLNTMYPMEYEHFNILKIGDYFVFYDNQQIHQFQTRSLVTCYGKRTNYMNKYLRVVSDNSSIDFDIETMKVVHDTKWNDDGFAPLFSTVDGSVDVLAKKSYLYKIRKNGRDTHLTGIFDKMKLVDHGTRVCKINWSSVHIYDPHQNRFADVTPRCLRSNNIHNFDFCKEKHCLSLQIGNQVYLWDIRYDRYPYFSVPCNLTRPMCIDNTWLSVAHENGIGFYSCADPSNSILLKMDKQLTYEIFWNEQDLHLFTFPTTDSVYEVQHKVYSLTAK